MSPSPFCQLCAVRRRQPEQWVCTGGGHAGDDVHRRSCKDLCVLNAIACVCGVPAGGRVGSLHARCAAARDARGGADGG